MNRPRRVMACTVLLLACGTPNAALAQPVPQPASTSAESGDAVSSLWLTAGTAFATTRGDCQTCEAEYPYRHAASVLTDIGYRVNRRMDVGAEVFWMGVNTSSGQIRVTHLDAVAQFRPWVSKGFFVKGGAGMAFVRNWVDVVGDEPINSKALSILIGTGWAFRCADRFGFEVFGTQHAAALGDLQTGETTVNDVMINFWSIGVAVVIR